MKIAGKIVGDGGEILDRIGGAGLPRGGESVHLRGERYLSGNVEEPKVRVIRFRNLLVRARGTAQRKSHVGLSRRDPDFSDHDVLNKDGLFASNRQAEWSAGMHCRQPHAPAAPGVCDCRP